MNNIMVRDETKLHNVPTKVISTMPIFILVMVISIIISIVLFCKRNIPVACIWLGAAFICWAWGKFVDIYYNFKKNYKIEFQNNKITATYDLDNQIYSSKDCTVNVVIKDISKIKCRRNSIMIYGNITIKKPRQNKKVLTKYVLDLKGFTECDNIRGAIQDYVI